MFRQNLVRAAVLSLAVGILAACDSAEERAAKHLENATDLLEAGDVQRAFVEFRNVFALDAGNIDARIAYAEANRDLGNLQESYASYLRVVEANPDHVEARLALTRLALQTQSWDEAERHGTALFEANVELPGVDTAKLALEFRKAALAKDDTRIRELTREARELLKTFPDDLILQRIIIDGLAREGDFVAALEIVDISIVQNPEDRSMYIAKARLLSAMGDQDGVEQHLRETVRRFPDDNESKVALIRQLAGRGRLDAAEQFLREDLAAAVQPEAAHVTLITFLRQVRGNEAALAEIATAIETYEDNRLFQALRAGITFDKGDRDTAILEMQKVLEGAEPSDETNRFKVTLAKMLDTTGNQVGARQLIEDVLETDPSQVDALKSMARWQIDADQPELALQSLRTALDREPEDSEALMLMSEAHQRNGSQELAQDLLAQAAEASDNAPRESLALATSLFLQERYRPAEDVLVRALRRSPGNIDLLSLLGQVHLEAEDWARAEQVEAALRRIDSEQAGTRAEELQYQIFGRREGRERAIAYLEELVAGDDTGSATAAVALIRARLDEGQREEALTLAQELVEKFPDNTRAKLVLGGTHIALKNYDEAETIIRATMQETNEPAAALQLVRVLAAQARVDEAQETLEVALQTSPEDINLLWVKASFLERAKDIDGAIEIYEQIYARDKRSPVIANNLASLLATYRSDDESLQRANAVARRLRGTQTPPFQDTYGWIMYRLGRFDEALGYLEPAAEGLPNDPIVQFHLGKVYEALGRREEMAEAFQRAVEVASEDDDRPQLVEAREYLEGNP
ncbi:tetratricopeptide repeat protein [Silicimonas sp. MF1-12-2]|uniref:tetratricopeptide repeat protein n=1 Tax=Silicimonas sp. MF1-12-2 TaxID=3384793 RepID=UPI0039B444B8